MRRWALVIAAVAMVGSCSDGGGNEVVEREAGIYGAVIQRVVEDTAESTAADNGLTVFLEALDEEEEIPLEVQAAVVQQLESVVAIRFIDDRAEAVDDSLPGEPVAGGGLLLRLGSAPRTGSTVEVTVERYVQHDESVVHRFTLGRTGGTWTVRDAVLASG